VYACSSPTPKPMQSLTPQERTLNPHPPPHLCSASMCSWLKAVPVEVQLRGWAPTDQSHWKVMRLRLWGGGGWGG
jgi:hypothetical protein